MRVVITGGAGFIGHNIALSLSEKGYDVVVIDTLERSSSFALQRLSEKGIPLIKGDVRDRALLKSQLSRGDIVIHAAAYISVEESTAKPEIYFENNVMGTLAVARACLESGAGMIYISSASVYGEPIQLPINEGHPTKPISPYGLTKLFGEEILELYRREGLDYTILRLFNVYGPGQSGAYAGVIIKFIDNALNGQSIVIYGDGSQTRDFVQVKDVAQAVELAIAREAFGEKLNIGSGKPTTINELAELVRRLACGSCKVEYRPPRPGDIKHSYADISKAKKLIGYNPKISLEEGIREIVALKKSLKL